MAATPTTRVLAVLELLQARGTVDGAELAERLQVDRRTVRRYIAALAELGVPIEAERGRYGGYRLMPGFRLPPLMFNDDEALALTIGLAAARHLGLAEAAPAVASAQSKLERVTPPALKRRIRAVGETIALDLARAPAANNAALVTLSAAALAQQRVAMRYLSAQQEASSREFDPYGLGYRGGRWYAVGHCHLRGGLRSFRLDRIESVEPVPASFLRPEGFDVLGHLAESLATLPRAFAVEVLLAAPIEKARAELFAAFGVLQALPGGGVLLRTQADSLEWVARELARLPFDFEVRKPRALQDAVAAHARRLLRTAAAKG
jgi:predicted DNA-binding transcriptional regulator YafY